MDIILNSMCLAILQAITDSNGAVTVDDIADMLNISKRSVYYSLKIINKSLKKNDMDEIAPVRNKGIIITLDFKLKLKSVIKSSRNIPVSFYIMSSAERLSLIICCIYIDPGFYTIERLAEVSDVSKSTIQKDLKSIKKVLSKYGLSLCYTTNSGYKISGNTFMVRAIFLYYLNIIYGLIDDKKIPVDWIQNSKKQYKKLKSIEKELGILYVNILLEKLSILIQYSKNDIKQEDLKIDDATLNSREYELVNKYFSNVSYTEKQYIALFMMSGRSQTINEYKISNTEYPVINQLALKMVDKFQQTACVEFDNKDKLIKNIMYHIICSVNRYKYGWLEVNELRDQIIERYPEYFYFSEIVVSSLNDEFTYPITNDEIAYFALHFGAHIRNNSYGHHKLRIILVCPNGISTTSMLVKEIEELNLEVEIVDIVPMNKLQEYNKKFDLIISTVAVTSKFPVLKVHPVLTNADKSSIYSYINGRKEKNYIHSDLFGLMNKLDKYIFKNKKACVQEILTDYLKHKSIVKEENQSSNLAGLSELITKDVITLSSGDLSWENAIMLCGLPLLQNDDILTDYINKTIQYLKKDGPYSVFPNGMLLAHAKCEDGAKNLSISILISKKGVPFSDGTIVNFIALLATPDNKCHLRALNELVEIFSDNEFVDKINKSSSVDKIYELIHNYQFKSYTASEESEDGI